jgi:hypothetical protein
VLFGHHINGNIFDNNGGAGLGVEAMVGPNYVYNNVAMRQKFIAGSQNQGEGFWIAENEVLVI